MNHLWNTLDQNGQPHKMVKYTQSAERVNIEGDELFECVCPCMELALKGLISKWNGATLPYQRPILRSSAVLDLSLPPVYGVVLPFWEENKNFGSVSDISLYSSWGNSNTHHYTFFRKNTVCENHLSQIFQFFKNRFWIILTFIYP